MKIYSPRHPKRNAIKNVVLPILPGKFESLVDHFAKVYAIEDSFPWVMPGTNEIVTIKEVIDAEQRDIIAQNQLSAERVKRMAEALTAHLVVPTPNILK